MTLWLTPDTFRTQLPMEITSVEEVEAEDDDMAEFKITFESDENLSRFDIRRIDEFMRCFRDTYFRFGGGDDTEGIIYIGGPENAAQDGY